MNKRTTSPCISAQSVPRDHVVGNVYFLTCDHPDFPIKIGFTADPGMRVLNIGRGLPYAVVVLAIVPGSRCDERKILRHFRSQRLRGEWFSRSPELLTAIERAKAGHYPLPSSDPQIEAHLAAIRKMDFSETVLP